MNPGGIITPHLSLGGALGMAPRTPRDVDFLVGDEAFPDAWRRDE
jgi:hypothetical protein